MPHQDQAGKSSGGLAVVSAGEVAVDMVATFLGFK
jgi:hypothetical protein